MQSRDHWNRVYATNTPTRVSWFQEHAPRSAALIRQAGLSKEAAIIDVGGAASTLVDDLVVDDYCNVKVLDQEHRTPGGATQKFIYCMCRKETSSTCLLSMRGVSGCECECRVFGKIFERAATVTQRFDLAIEGRFAVCDELEAATRAARDGDAPMPPSFLLENVQLRGCMQCGRSIRHVTPSFANASRQPADVSQCRHHFAAAQ